MAQKKFCGQKVKVKVKVNSHSRPLRFHHLLLQFLTDLDKTGCILFTIGWANFCMIRNREKVFFTTNVKMKWPPFCFEIKIQNSDRTKASPSDCEENATRIIQIG